MTHHVTGWPEALDRFEQRLDQLRTVLEENADPVPGAWPPGDITTDPIPAELVLRARTLLAQARELEDRMAGARQALHHPPAPHHRPRPFAGRPTISAQL